MADSEVPKAFGLVRPLSPFKGATDGATLGYGSAPTGEAAPLFVRAAPFPRRAGGRKQDPSSITPDPETRVALRTHWAAAKKAAAAMRDAAFDGDAMALGVAADELDIALAKLWGLRAARDVNWRTILNHVQGMLKQLFAAKKVEQLTEQQCGHVFDLIDRYLGPSTKTAEDMTEAIRLIEDAGCDPYGAISGDPIEGLEE